MAIHFSKVIFTVFEQSQVPMMEQILRSIDSSEPFEVHILTCANVEVELNFNRPISQRNSKENHLKNLQEYAEEIGADLLIIPTSKNEKSKNHFSTNDACKLIDKIERLVLTIPETYKQVDFSKILVPIDTSFETRQKVPYAVRFGKLSRSIMHVLGVSNENGKDATVLIQNYIRQVSDNMVEKGFDCEIDYSLGGNPTDQALQYAIKNSCGLIVIMTEQEVSLTTFFKGRYSDQLVKKSDVPVLSIHPKDLILSEARL